MVTSKLELLVDFGQKTDEKLLDKTLSQLQSTDGIEKATFKDGAILVETTLPSAEVVDLTAQISGKRTVLQGFGETGHSAVAIIDNGPVKGVVRLSDATSSIPSISSPSTPSVLAEGCLDGLSGDHYLRVHGSGDLTQGCDSIGSTLFTLGTISADETGRAKFRIIDGGVNVYDVIGRALSISEKIENDRGDSLKPLACGIIARASGVLGNPKRICACDGVVVWDERDRALAGKGRRDTCCKGNDSGNSAFDFAKKWFKAFN